MEDKIKNEMNCWDCSYQQIGGDIFLGKCTWFSKHKQGAGTGIEVKKQRI